MQAFRRSLEKAPKNQIRDSFGVFGASWNAAGAKADVESMSPVLKSSRILREYL
jgi:hypothetical protein